jgi:hypothetical protein
MRLIFRSLWYSEKFRKEKHHLRCFETSLTEFIALFKPPRERECRNDENSPEE